MVGELSGRGQARLSETGLSLDSRASEVELLPCSLSGLGEAFPGPESFLPEEGACCLPQAWMKLMVSCPDAGFAWVQAAASFPVLSALWPSTEPLAPENPFQ